MTFLRKSCFFQKKVVPLHSKMKEIWKNSARLLTANVFAQAIGLLVYPILTRLYSPDDFGLFNLFLSIGGILVLCSTAEYQNAIVLPKEQKKANALFHVGAGLVLGMTLVALLSVPFSRPIANLFNTPSLARWYWLMPIYVLVMGGWVLLNYYYTREKAFQRISGYQVSQSVLSAGSKVGFGYAGFLSGGLIVGSVLAPLISFIISVLRAGKKWLGGLLHLNIQECKQVAKEYANFPKFALPRSLINSLGGNLPILLLTPFFSLSEIGYFGMALTLGFRPLNMISGSLCQTFFQQTADAINHRRPIFSFFRNFILWSLLILCLSFAALYFILPWLTGWLLGSGWEETGELIRVLLPWLAVSTVSASLGFVSDVFGKQKMSAIIEFTYTGLRALAIGVGIWSQDFRLAIITYSLVGLLVQSFLLVWYLVLAKSYDNGILMNKAE